MSLVWLIALRPSGSGPGAYSFICQSTRPPGNRESDTACDAIGARYQQRHALVIRARSDYRITRNTTSKIRVTATDTATEPTMPRRLEKNTNMATRSPAGANRAVRPRNDVMPAAGARYSSAARYSRPGARRRGRPGAARCGQPWLGPAELPGEPIACRPRGRVRP